MSHGRQILNDLADPTFRTTYSESLYNGFIAAQIRSNREARGLTRVDLAAIAGVSPSAIARLEDASSEKWSIATLRRAARALDLALSVRLVSFAEALRETDRFGAAALVRLGYAHATQANVDGESGTP